MAGRTSYIQIDGKLYDTSLPLPEGVRNPFSTSRTATVLGDQAGFVSPIDGTFVDGRKAMREHCAKHNVVPTADLAGLPNKPMNQEYKVDREAIRRELHRRLADY